MVDMRYHQQGNGREINLPLTDIRFKITKPSLAGRKQATATRMHFLCVHEGPNYRNDRISRNISVILALRSLKFNCTECNS